MNLKVVVIKLSQARRTHPDIGLLITSLLQDVNRPAVSCAFLVVYLRADFHSLFFLDGI